MGTPLNSFRTLSHSLAVAAVLMAGVASAQDLGAVQARMRERLGKIATLKTQKVVGEDRMGLLATLQATAPNEVRQLVDAENADRKAVYAAIAAKTGASPEQVARQRAKELADKAAPGVMVQGEDGTWREKR